MAIRIKKINNVQVKPMNGAGPKKPYSPLFDKEYENVALVGKRERGKSTILHLMVEDYMKRDKKRLLFLFSSTADDDPIWQDIIKRYEKRIKVYDTLGFSDELADEMSLDFGEDERPRIDKKHTRLREFVKSVKEIHADEPRNKRTKFLCVIDDLSGELKDKYFESFLKIARHHNITVFMAYHYFNDLTPGARKVIGVWLLFGEISKQKMMELHEQLDLQTPFDEFYELYRYATQGDHSFFYMDVNSKHTKYRINFDKQFNV